MTIGFQKTPGRPTEITFDADTGLPNDQQELLLIGRAGAGATGTDTVITISAVADSAAAKTEAETKFGVGSEMANMVVAAVKANASAARSTFPPIKCIPLANGASAISANALIAAKTIKSEFIASCFDASTDTANRTLLKDLCAELSGAQRVENNQFGTIGVAANMSVADPANLDSPDSQYLALIWMKNLTPGSYTVGELAASAAAVMAGNIAPFNPIDNFVLGAVTAPLLADRISVGAGLQSETALGKGWTPVKTKPNEEVAIVRSVTSRITTDGVVAAGAYYDVQDFQVLYYWRKTIFTRLNQPDLKTQKASVDTAKLVKGELIRLAQIFETNTMFQAVKDLAPSFTVARSISDRHRFDVVTPVNVIPGLHLIATTIRAGTLFDTVSV